MRFCGRAIDIHFYTQTVTQHPWSQYCSS
jgi:hypothetical protein